jgi:sugar lactone lactonase YvrE
MSSIPAGQSHVAPLSVAITLPANEVTIGSTSPATPHDVNPYGLDVARVTSGDITAGDLVVCDFNDPGNVQGTGTEIVRLHPTVGSTPFLVAKSTTLTGCNAIAMAPNGTIWAAAFKANDNPIFSGSGTLINALSNGPWNHPFGETFAIGHSAFYVSNAGDGSIVRVSVPALKFTTIATGFPVNGGKPGSILSPSGLNYEPATDTLIVVDGTNNALYAIHDVSSVGANGIAVDASGVNFSGPSSTHAHVVFTGAPLNGPISSAILPSGTIAVGNTLDPDGKNLIVEISSAGSVLKILNVDTGPAGAIFGMVRCGTIASPKICFNDDNDNTVKRFTP